MKKNYLMSLIMICFLSISVTNAAITVNVTTAGTLEQVLFDQTEEDFVDIVDLTVTGSINAVDITLLNTMSKTYALRTLNLSDANVEGNTFANAAFKETLLEHMVLPKTLESMGNECFHSAALISIDMPTTNLEVIPPNCFVASKLTSVDIPEGVTTIGKEAFVFCSALTTLTLPASLTSIEENAFLGNFGFEPWLITIPLTNIYANMTTVPTIGSYGFAIFGSWNTCTLHVPAGTEDAYRANIINNEYGFGLIANIVALNTGLNAPSSEFQVFSSTKNIITINDIRINSPIAVYSISGTLVKLFNAESETVTCKVPNSGIYIVKVGSKATKISL